MTEPKYTNGAILSSSRVVPHITGVPDGSHMVADIDRLAGDRRAIRKPQAVTRVQGFLSLTTIPLLR